MFENIGGRKKGLAVLLVIIILCLNGCDTTKKGMEQAQNSLIEQLSAFGYECLDFCVENEVSFNGHTDIYYSLTVSGASQDTNDYKSIYNCLKSIHPRGAARSIYYLRYVEISGIRYALSYDEWSLHEYGKREILYNLIADTPFDELTESMKKTICSEIESQYKSYDLKEGKYSGDKYSDIIWEKIQKKYNLSHTEVSIIWGHQHEY